MFRSLAVLAVSALSVSAAEIPRGTHVLLRMMNSLSTRTAREGDYVYLRTANPIAVDGRVLVPPGAYVQGVVTHAKRSGRVAGRAELAIRLESVTLPRGTAFKFTPKLASVDSEGTDQKVEGSENVVKQGGDRGRDAARIAILAGSGASVGGLVDRGWRGAGIGAAAGGGVGLATVLLSRGREIELRRGATLDVVFDRPVALD